MKKILLIEDDVHVQSFLKTLLERYNLSVQAFFDGEDAKEAFLADPCDLVITDIHLPDMNALEIIHALRLGYEDLPIIVITGGDRVGGASEGLIEQVKTAGVSGVFMKPFDHEALIELVQKELKNQGRGFLQYVEE